MSDGHTLLMGAAEAQKSSSICLQSHRLAVLFYILYSKCCTPNGCFQMETKHFRGGTVFIGPPLFFYFYYFIFVLKNATKTKKVQHHYSVVFYVEMRTIRFVERSDIMNLYTAWREKGISNTCSLQLLIKGEQANTSSYLHGWIGRSSESLETTYISIPKRMWLLPGNSNICGSPLSFSRSFVRLCSGKKVTWLGLGKHLGFS